MSALPTEVCWPLERLGEAVEALARAAGLPMRATGLPSPSPGLVQPGGLALARWMDGAGSWLGLEAEFIEARYKDAERLIRTAGPAIVRLFGPTPAFVVLVGARGNRARVRTVDDEPMEIDVESLRSAFCAIVEKPLLSAVDSALENADIPEWQRDRARRAMLREQFRGVVLRGCWMLRRAPHEPLQKLWSQAKLGRKLTVLILARAVEYTLLLLAWWVAGRGVLGGHLDVAWLMAWLLVLLSALPFRVAGGWFAGRLGIDLGTLIKQRLIQGSLLLDPGEVRSEGAGHLIGRVLEADALETLTVSGGLMGIMAAVELLMAAFVLCLGPAAWTQGPSLLVWIGLVTLLAVFYMQRRREWTDTRLSMTHGLIENIVGHRTRLAQEDPQHWYDADDRQIQQYLASSRRLDRIHATLVAFVPRGWLVVGIGALGPVFVAGTASTPALAVALGGTLLAFRALRTLTTGLSDLLGAWVAWEQIRPLQRAAERAEATTSAALATIQRTHLSPGETIMQVQSVLFQHAGRHAPVLVDCSLEIRHGDRLLLEGPSGSGKSTLGAIMAGLRVPRQGLLLLHGLDRPTLGLTGWRRHVAAAPQFHENHILSAPLAFNLLLGRQWPPATAELELAEQIARELGLGDMIDRMPGGMLQMVGETGWQLSHGEKSRIYVARTILQGVDLVILDESFAALDPETLQLALSCVLAHTPSLLLIAHP